MGFWISAAAMIAMVALVLVQALRQGRAQPLAAPGAEDMGVYRDQLTEIDRDLSRGTLAAAEADRLRTEVQRRMLDADRAATKVKPAVTGASFPPTASVVVVVLAAALAGYYWLGAPGYPDLPLSARIAQADDLYQHRPSQAQAEAAQPAFVPDAKADPKMLELMTKLRNAMATRPDDMVGQSLLARNEAALGNFVAARKAQEAMVRIKGDVATGEDLATLAEAMIYAAGGMITPETEAVLKRCLTVEPHNGSARFYVGLMFAQVGRPDETFKFWQPLLAEGPADAVWIAPIRARIAAVAAEAGINYTLPPVSKGPDAAAVAAAAQMTASDRQAMIRTMVDGLEARLKSEGGPVEDWAKLITSLGVLEDMDGAQTAYDAAQVAYVGKPGELAALRAAAVQAGIER